MKQYTVRVRIACLLLLAGFNVHAQTGNIGIGTVSPAASSMLDITATNKGFLPPRVALTGPNDVTTIPNPVAGLTVYNTTTSKLSVWTGTEWTEPINTSEAPFQNAVVTFNFTGAEQTYVVPEGVTSIKVDASGARGGGFVSPSRTPGYGGRVTAKLTVTPLETLYVFVGGYGLDNAYSGHSGGYNGGGSTSNNASPGGGATDIRSGGNGLANRILVAGGGGGSAGIGGYGFGGHGGGLIGVGGSGLPMTGGQGGSQTAGGNPNGALGQGANSIFLNAGGGGGGYFGGGRGSDAFSGGGGGGGSSFVIPTDSSGALHFQGVNTGHGVITITPDLAYFQPAIGVANLTGVLPALDGNAIVNLNASNLSTGIIPNERFPVILPALSGINLTALNASNLTSGFIPAARLSTVPASGLTGSIPAANLTNVPAANLTGTCAAINGSLITNLNGANISGNAITNLNAANLTGTSAAINGSLITNLNGANISGNAITNLNAANIAANGTLPVLNGSAITSLNATNITSGTISSARLPSPLPALNASALTNLNAAQLSGVLNNGIGVGSANPGDGLFIATAEKSSVSPSNGVYISGGASGQPSIELRINGGTPYIDFSRDLTSDNTSRIIQNPSNLHIQSSLVVIGTAPTGTVAAGIPLYVGGSICASGGLNCSSDLRYKDHITTLSGALDKVLKMRGVNYYWKQKEFPAMDFPASKQLGVIAQELEQQYPELVTTDKAGYKSVDYTRLAPILIEAIKEQQAIIDELKIQNKEQKAAIGADHASLLSIQQELELMRTGKTAQR